MMVDFVNFKVCVDMGRCHRFKKNIKRNLKKYQNEFMLEKYNTLYKENANKSEHIRKTESTLNI